MVFQSNQVHIAPLHKKTLYLTSMETAIYRYFLLLTHNLLQLGVDDLPLRN
jgi:hypothetical protein